MMRVAILNTFDVKGGAAIAAFRLNKGLQAIGVDSKMLVQQKTCDDHTVSAPPPIWRKGLALVRPFLDNLPLLLYPRRERIIFSPAFLPDRVSARVSDYNPDIIHLHWVASGFLRIETLRRFKKPIIWTLHDSWAFTGGCHLPFDCKRYEDFCGRCPILGSGGERDISQWVLRRKQKAWKGVDIMVVTPSRWLASCAKRSLLFRDRHIEVIPNGLDTERFKPMDRKILRDFLSLPMDRRLITFGALWFRNDRVKGFHLLQQVLKKLSVDGWSERAELLVFGSSEPETPTDFGMRVRYMGELNNEISLAMIYAASDVFVLPSLQENLPNTVMESLACGTPVVAFNVGGIPDMVEHRKNGYLARPFDTDDLASGIVWVLDEMERARKLGMAAREKAVREYSLEVQARRYVRLYDEMLKNKG